MVCHENMLDRNAKNLFRWGKMGGGRERKVVILKTYNIANVEWVVKGMSKLFGNWQFIQRTKRGRTEHGKTFHTIGTHIE